jgi:hypothetical protein
MAKLNLEYINSKTTSIKIHIAGPIDIAKQYLREYCLKGLCVTLTEELFIYTAGEEMGYVVGIENYPMYPTEYQDLFKTAIEIAEGLIEVTHQSSAMVVTNNFTRVISRRKELPLKDRDKQ